MAASLPNTEPSRLRVLNVSLKFVDGAARVVGVLVKNAATSSPSILQAFQLVVQ